jgi:phage anti-repressor protein
MPKHQFKESQMNTNTLIPVFAGELSGMPVQLVDARLLHTFLESAQDFSDWVKKRIKAYGFIENTDYLLHKFMEQLPSGAKSKIDYHLTIDMAKELGMIERNDKGRQIRRYFLDMERVAIQLSTNPLQLEPPTITKAQEGILFNKVKDISGGSGKIRAELWSRFQNHYNLSSYKNLPANQYEDAVQYLEAKQKEYLGHGVEMFYISSKEIEERAKSLVGELVEKPEVHQHNSITINLAPLVDFKHRRWLVTQALDEMTIVMALTSDQEVKSKEQFIDDLIKEGYVIIKKDDFHVGNFVMEHLPAHLLPVLVEKAGRRLSAMRV